MLFRSNLVALGRKHKVPWHCVEEAADLEGQMLSLLATKLAVNSHLQPPRHWSGQRMEQDCASSPSSHRGLSGRCSLPAKVCKSSRLINAFPILLGWQPSQILQFHACNASLLACTYITRSRNYSKSIQRLTLYASYALNISG